jgi:hypothetical protein
MPYAEHTAVFVSTKHMYTSAAVHCLISATCESRGVIESSCPLHSVLSRAQASQHSTLRGLPTSSQLQNIMATDGRSESGFYCSTSGTYFVDKESLSEHYKSDFHRYNLKRKVAGLPPVTHEWFEARKVQLSQTSAEATTKVWIDPLTKKKFSSENTYQAHIKSKKYQELVRKSGQPAPAPVVYKKAEGVSDTARPCLPVRRPDATLHATADTKPQQQQLPARTESERGFVMKPPIQSLAVKQVSTAPSCL